MSHKTPEDERKREHRKEREQKREAEWEKQPRKIAPHWFVVMGVILIAMVVATWTWIF